MQTYSESSELPVVYDPHMLDTATSTRRTPSALILDVSSSMSSVMHELNLAADTMCTELKAHEVAADSVELEIITVRSHASVHQPFMLARDLNYTPIHANGATDLGGGINLALDDLLKRQMEYMHNGIQAYVPMVFLLTDGAPTKEWQSAAGRVHQLAAAKKLFFFGIGTSTANMDILRQICPPDMPPKMMADGKFAELFRFVSDSLSNVAKSVPGQTVPLPTTDPWAALGA